MRIILAIVMLFFGLISYGQSVNVSDVTKGANCAVLKPKVSGYDEIYKAIGAYITDKGYALGKADKDLGIITTEYKQSNWGLLKLQFVIKDSTVHLTAQSMATGLGIDQVSNIGARGSYAKTRFIELYKIANAFPSSAPVEFIIK
ncbi:MAG: hypothetical protein J7619_11850 [Dyadobacter sp.]|uniref:hypothetical protein n=1 Tax=Dyadobacter sp. TaxID=1914288 RepID=UPI001B107E2C|nr:hypothetical protein [Dyadobacter sp.]MBO9613386.1 hypothetical protein [Dyadobacter sp.]